MSLNRLVLSSNIFISMVVVSGGMLNSTLNGIFVSASHQTGHDTRSKVGVWGEEGWS